MEMDKTKERNIHSAFLKGDIKEHLLLFYADERVAGSVAKNEVTKIMFALKFQRMKNRYSGNGYISNQCIE